MNSMKCLFGRLLEKRLDVWFFYGFLFTFTLSIRKVITFYPIKNDFNEFTGIYLYLSDLFLIVAILLWGLSILCNNLHYLSSKTFRHFKDAQAWLGWLNPVNNPLVLIPLYLVIWSFISIFWSSNQIIAIFRSIKLLEFYLLYLYIKSNFGNLLLLKNVSRGTLNESKDNQGEKNNVHLEDALELGDNTINNVPCGTLNDANTSKLVIIKNFFGIIIAIGLFNAFLAFLQKANNGSIGLYFLKESLFKPDLSGVAKITLGSSLFVRPYGLFPHPNILGAFLLVALVITVLYFSIFDQERKNWLKCSTWNIFTFLKKFFRLAKFVPRGTKSNSHETRNVPRGTICENKFEKKYSQNSNTCSNSVKMFHVEHSIGQTWNIFNKIGLSLSSAITYGLFLIIPLFALFLTFSKNAVIGLIAAFLFISYSSFSARNGQDKLKVANLMPFIRERLISKRNLLLIAIFMMLLINIRPSFDSFISTSFNDRLVYQNVSRGTIIDNLFTGVGMGQFVTTMNDYSAMPLLKWQYQPVHNVFSLIWSELGIIGLILFISFIFTILKSFRSIPMQGPMFHIKTAFRGILIAFLIMMLFDHYAWDIQQGQALFWMILALV